MIKTISLTVSVAAAIFAGYHLWQALKTYRLYRKYRLEQMFETLQLCAWVSEILKRYYDKNLVSVTVGNDGRHLVFKYGNFINSVYVNPEYDSAYGVAKKLSNNFSMKLN